ncbi:zinc-finger domain-containing protein [Pradoshia sp.]
MRERGHKKNTFRQVDRLLNTYCEGCFLHKQLVTDHGRRHAHRFCITKCTVGEQLKMMGSQLNEE